MAKDDKARYRKGNNADMTDAVGTTAGGAAGLAAGAALGSVAGPVGTVLGGAAGAAAGGAAGDSVTDGAQALADNDGMDRSEKRNNR